MALPAALPPVVAAGCPSAWPWDQWAGRLRGTLLCAITAADAPADSADLRRAALRARRGGVRLLPVLISAGEVRVGPPWLPDGPGACPFCAATADRRIPMPAVSDATAPWMAPIIGALLCGEMEPGTVVTISATGQIRRHRIPRNLHCTLCGTPGVPEPRTSRLGPRAASPDDPTRTDRNPATLAGAVRRISDGRRFGMTDRHVRLSRAAFAVTEIGLHQGTPVGMGRGATLREADDIALLEAFERLSGNPGPDDLLHAVAAAELESAAVPLQSLGRCSPLQLRSPRCRVRPFDEHTPMDWASAIPATGGPAVLVPADIAYPWYRYRDESGDPQRTRYFLDSSSGTALGANPEEALLHALFELIERDQFQLAWHRRTRLPRLDLAGITDPKSRLLMHVIDRSGFDLHLLVATSDIALPVVWAMAVNRNSEGPATFSTAGAHPDPERAIRAALWELAQQASTGIGWDVESVRPLVADPWQVQDLSDHWRRYTDPAVMPRVLACVGTDTVTMADAFPGWPGKFAAHARGDLLRGVHLLCDLLADAGMTTVLAVDQSTPAHAAAGASVIRAVVPGIIGLNFGQANQRYTGLNRLLGGVGVGSPDDHPDSTFPNDPHPFP